MFQAVGDLVTGKWLREHPLVTTSVAAANVAYSYLPFVEPEAGLGGLGGHGQSMMLDDNEEKVELERLPAMSSEEGRGISWGDERGGKLAQFIEPQQQEPVPQSGAGKAEPVPSAAGSAQQPEEGGSLLMPKCMANATQSLATQSPSAFATQMGQGGQPAAARRDEDEAPSPQWGWFVSTSPESGTPTAPSSMFHHGGPSRPDSPS